MLKTSSLHGWTPDFLPWYLIFVGDRQVKSDIQLGVGTQEKSQTAMVPGFPSMFNTRYHHLGFYQL